MIQEEQAKRDNRRRFHWNRMAFHLRAPFRGGVREMVRIARRLEAPTRGLGLQKVVVRVEVMDPATGLLREQEVVISNPSGSRLEVHFRAPNH